MDHEITYCVLYHHGDWHIESDGNLYGPHSSQELALKTALAAAKRAKQDGQPARVLLQSNYGVKNIWQYGWHFQHSPAMAYAC